MNAIPTVTKNILIINVLVFFATIVAASYGINLDHYLGLHFFLSEDFNAAQLITYMFMHGGFTHLFFNMFAVWMFGRILEQVWGPGRFLSYYMMCGIGAGLINMLVVYLRIRSVETGMTPEMIDVVYQEGTKIWHQSMNYTDPAMASLNALINVPTVGASGSVYAILLGFGMLFPNQPLFIFPFPFPIKAKYFVIGYALIELYSGFANNPNDNVAHFAHLGGMIFGFILITYWRKKDRGNDYYYN
ncbi:rhomboid family intramembrane serine protease [uncultured Bacteroides sp.]|uniref:rhomboid family intramembrane serine protease n=1 Tax=uncultured Bacteroides sp. TaxID=162156 RepID=UPI0026016810|nr:rhomboid family intramembrane serine protease [uncultured Bacteroides sp.]